jgi:low affinity Fe/Cu permease
MKATKSRTSFGRFAKYTSHVSGTPMAFSLAMGTIIVWALTGPMFGYSDTWQLVINTGTTVVTFLMVFLIQNTQNRDSQAIQVKLDEIIRCTKGAHNVLLNLEELEEEELCAIQIEYTKIAELARDALRRGKPDTDTPEVQPVNSGQ